MANRIVFIGLLATIFFCTTCQNKKEISENAVYADNHEINKPTMAHYFDNNLNLSPPVDTGKIIWEVEIFPTHSKSGSVMRLHDDGSIFSWTNTRRVIVDGKHTRQPAPYAWRLDAKVSEEGISEVCGMIREEFVKLKSKKGTTSASDQGMVQWRSFLKDSLHVVKYPTLATEHLPPVINKIDFAIQSHIIPGAIAWLQDE